MVAQSFNYYSKTRLCLAEIEAFVDFRGWSVVGDLENGGQAATEHVGRLFEAS